MVVLDLKHPAVIGYFSPQVDLNQRTRFSFSSEGEKVYLMIFCQSGDCKLTGIVNESEQKCFLLWNASVKLDYERRAQVQPSCIG